MPCRRTAPQVAVTPEPELATPTCDRCDLSSLQPQDIYTFDGRDMCLSCYTAHTTECEDCGDTVSRDDVIERSGNHICSSCNESYTDCYRCRTDINIRSSEAMTDPDGRTYCRSCYYDVYTHCHSCMTVIEYNDSETVDGNEYCTRCYDDLPTCYNCEAQTSSTLQTEDEDGDPIDVCSSCYRNMTSSPRGITIYDYGYKPKAKFHRESYEKQDKSVFFGLELEVEGSGKIKVPDELKGSLYFKRDGSLDNGVEIVSHPMTYQWIKNNRLKFKELLENLTKAKYNSFRTTTCGMHIHMTKDMFSSMHLYRFLMFFKNNAKFILSVSQRGSMDKMNRWASITGEDMTDHSIKYKVKDKDMQRSRYCAVNLANDHTVEIRVFKGTLNHESFFKNIEFAECIYQFSKHGAIEDMTAEKFIEFAAVGNYKYLTNFLKSKSKSKE